MGKIYFIRHGQTDSNSGRRFQGRINTPLNATGLQQAQKMADYFKDIDIDVIYSSSLDRAMHTAEFLATSKQLKVISVDELQEISFGSWEGLSYNEINEKWPRQIELFFANPDQCLPPEGESFDVAQKRAVQALKKILQREGEQKNIAIVTHGGIIRALVFALLDIPLKNFWKMNIGNTSVSCFSIWDGNFTAEIINDNHFLG